MIHYVSTRGQAGRRTFEEVLLAGLAEDGGLFVPESWPGFAPADLGAMRGLDYPTLAARVLVPFTADCFDEADQPRLARPNDSAPYMPPSPTRSPPVAT